MSAPDTAEVVAPGRFTAVTSAASGIGLAASHAFAAKGMRVALVDCAGAALKEAGHKLPSAHALDIANPDARVTLAEDLGKSLLR